MTNVMIGRLLFFWAGVFMVVYGVESLWGSGAGWIALGFGTIVSILAR